MSVWRSTSWRGLLYLNLQLIIPNLPKKMNWVWETPETARDNFSTKAGPHHIKLKAGPYYIKLDPLIFIKIQEIFTFISSVPNLDKKIELLPVRLTKLF